jgi:hypothetical protein
MERAGERGIRSERGHQVHDAAHAILRALRPQHPGHDEPARTGAGQVVGVVRERREARVRRQQLADAHHDPPVRRQALGVARDRGHLLGAERPLRDPALHLALADRLALDHRGAPRERDGIETVEAENHRHEPEVGDPRAERHDARANPGLLALVGLAAEVDREDRVHATLSARP